MNKNRKNGTRLSDSQRGDIAGFIYREYDYSKFKKMEANRSVKESRKNKVMASIKNKDLALPIAVTKKMEIFDGQATFEARRELGLPILYYFTIDDADIKDCRMLNSLNSNWNPADFVDSFAEEGSDDYRRLKDFLSSHPMNMTIIHTFLGNEKNASIKLKSGDLVFTEKEEARVLDLYQKSNEILDALAFSERPNNAFYKSVKIMADFSGYDHERMLKNCKKTRGNYAQQAGLESQLKVFSKIYNLSAHKKRLYFEDYMRNKGKNIRSYDNPVLPWLDHQNSADVSTLRR